MKLEKEDVLLLVGVMSELKEGEELWYNENEKCPCKVLVVLCDERGSFTFKMKSDTGHTYDQYYQSLWKRYFHIRKVIYEDTPVFTEEEN